MSAVNGLGLPLPEFHLAGSAAAAFAFTQPQAQPQQQAQPLHRHSQDHAHAPARAPGGEHLHWRAHAQAYLAEASLLSTEGSIGGSAERHQARYGEKAETAGGCANGFVSVPVVNGLSHGHGYGPGPAHFTAHVPLHSAAAATDRSTGFSDSAVPVTTAAAAAASTATAAAEAALHDPLPFSAVPCAAIPASSAAAVPPTTTLTLLLPSSSSGGGSAGSVGGAGDLMGSAAQAQAQASAAAMDSINRKTERVLCISSVDPGRDGERQGDMEGALTEVPQEGTSGEARLAETAHMSVSANGGSQWAQVVEIRGADAQAVAEAEHVAGVGSPDAVGGVDAAKVRNIDTAHGDPQMCTKYAAEIYANLRDGERRLRPTMALEEGRGGDISAAMRGILMDWLVEVAEEYKLVPDTLFLTAAYIDRFLSHATVTRNHLQLLGIASMLIASKYEEIYAPQVDEFCYITDNTYRRQEVLLMERHVLAVLHFDLSTPTVKSFLRRFVKAAQATLPSPQHHLEFLGNYFAELTLVDYPCLRFLPSQIAAAAVFLAKLTLYPALPPWVKPPPRLKVPLCLLNACARIVFPPVSSPVPVALQDATLQHYTGYAPSQLKEAVMALYDLQRNVKGCTLPAIREKYRQPKVLIHSSLQASPHSPSCPSFSLSSHLLSLHLALVSILCVADVWVTPLIARRSDGEIPLPRFSVSLLHILAMASRSESAPVMASLLSRAMTFLPGHIKEQREMFVSGHTGTSMFHVSALVTIVFILSAQRQLLPFLPPCIRPPELPTPGLQLAASVTADALLVIIPSLLTLTVLKDHLTITFVILAVILTTTAALATLNTQGPYLLDSSSWPLSPPSVTDSVITFRALLMLLTCTAILAVDFDIFPRNYAKTERYGTSLMDLGVGMFVIANTASQFGSSRIRTAGERKAHVSIQRFSRKLLPLLVLAIGRLLLTKVTNYQEHSSEYGVHWNFFFTLAAVLSLARLFPTPIRHHPSQLPPGFFRSLTPPVLLLIGYQAWLSFMGGSEWVLSDDREATSLISLNKEGICSTVGYLSLYLISLHFGTFLNSSYSAIRSAHGPLFAIVNQLLPLDLFLWLVTIVAHQYIEQTSRRSCNLAFVCWSLAQGVHAILIGELTCRSPSLVFRAIARFMLPTFLMANVGTGLVNITMDTLSQPPLTAIAINATYLCVLFFGVTFAHVVLPSRTERDSSKQKTS
ncbi:unnamed protein product [Closterium sp. Naga37s-1]|nr:unnamed protein product [Closterium sp. Naga37s-1]